MTTALQFAVLGLGIGAVYTLLAHGLVVVHQGSGVLNFAHGGMAMFGAFLFYEASAEYGWGFWTAFLFAVGSMTLLGVAFYLVVMRTLRNASALARVIATLGLLTVLQGVAAVKWGSLPRNVDPYLPVDVLETRGVFVSVDRLILVGIAASLTIALWAAFRYTRVGLAIRASAENPRSAASLGWSPDVLASLTWAVGSALAATAGVLIAPLTGVTVEELSMLILPVLAVALLASFTSYPLVFAGSLAIGIGQSEMTQYVHVQGLSAGLPFAVIIAILVIRGKGLPVRGQQLAEKLPEVGLGRVNPWVVGVAVAVIAYLIMDVFPIRLVDALIVSFAWSTLLLSVVVLLGYTGQLSFEQMVMGGLAALIAGRLVSDLEWNFAFALVAGVALAVPIGLLFALPALRTRGVNLAVVTLGLGWTITQVIFLNRTYSGGIDGTEVGAQTFLGIDIDAITHPQRYALLVFLAFVLCALVVASVRRGNAGRRLIAVRTNERAAAALGISVFGAKLYAFALGGAIAGIGGILLGFRSHTIVYTDFFPIQSVLAVGYSVIGGVGFLFGAQMGSHFAHGSIGSWISGSLFPDANPSWLVVIGGIFVLGMVMLHPDGIVSVWVHQARWIRTRVDRRRGRVRPGEPLPAVELRRVPSAKLEATGIVVRFGGVTAVDGVSVTVGTGEVVRLIGPNGAGKTTLIDAVSGFTRPQVGAVRLNGTAIDRWAVHRRTRGGLSRSFQQLELFENSTVRENLQVASDSRDAHVYVTDLVRPAKPKLSPAAIAAVDVLGLAGFLDERVSDLPYGSRRLVAIARAIAVEPSILLLDEPAAGLSGAEVVELATIVRRLAAEWGLGILVVEHDMGFVMAVCDRIVALDFGHPIATGTPAEIRADPAVRKAYLGADDPSPASEPQLAAEPA